MILNKEEHLMHINDMDQMPNMRRILDLIEIVMRDHSLESTDFYDPYTRRLAVSILNQFENIGYIQLGAVENAERKSILIYPDYHFYMDDESPISALRITGNLEELKHPDFLGAILNLGFTRDKLGDIFIHDGYADIVIKNEIKNFILTNLSKIKNVYVKVEPIELSDVKYSRPNYKIVNRTLQSLRLDSLISASYNLSRDIGQNLVKLNRVKVNYEPIDKVSFTITEGDLISVRGYGRILLKKIVGFSRKNRYIVEIAKIV